MTVSRPICISIICISVVIISPSRQRQCTASPSGGLFQSAQTATAPSIVVVCKNSTCAVRTLFLQPQPDDQVETCTAAACTEHNLSHHSSTNSPHFSCPPIAYIQRSSLAGWGPACPL